MFLKAIISRRYLILRKKVREINSLVSTFSFGSYFKSNIHVLGFFYFRILQLAHTQDPLWAVGMSKLSYILVGQMPTRRYLPRSRNVRLFKQTRAIRSRSPVTPILAWRAPQNSSRQEVLNKTKFTFFLSYK